jgi:hypothetical protein
MTLPEHQRQHSPAENLALGFWLPELWDINFCLSNQNSNRFLDIVKGNQDEYSEVENRVFVISFSKFPEMDSDLLFYSMIVT